MAYEMISFLLSYPIWCIEVILTNRNVSLLLGAKKKKKKKRRVLYILEKIIFAVVCNYLMPIFLRRFVTIKKDSDMLQHTKASVMVSSK